MLRSISLAFVAVLCGVLLVLAGCGGGGSNGATIRGAVLDAAGAAVTGATVSAGTLSVQTTATGYTLAGVPAGTAVVSVRKAGYVTTQDVATVADGGAAVIDFRLQAVGNTGTFPNVNTVPVMLTDDRADTRNATVDIPAGAILDANDNPVVSATVAVTTNLPSDAGYVDTFPGLYLGTVGAGAAAPIESFGFVDVELTDASGNKLKLDPTKPATITFPIDPANDPGDATIPVWSLNETTGVWEQDVDGAGNLVVATRTTLPGGQIVYIAQVIHFSPHNLDRQFTGNTLVVTVNDMATGGTVAGAWVTLWSTNGGADPNGRWEGRGVTAANGTFTFTNVPTGFLSAKAGLGDRVGNANGFDGAAGTMAISLPAPAGPITVTVLDHLDNPVSGATVHIGGHGQPMGRSTGIDLTGTTGANGKVTFPLVPAAEFLMVQATKGWLSKGTEGPRAAFFTIKFDAPVATSNLAVTVLDTDGTTLVPGATVRIGFWSYADFTAVLTGTTNANGVASFTGVPSSGYFAIQAASGTKTANGSWYDGQPRTVSVTLSAQQAAGKRK